MLANVHQQQQKTYTGLSWQVAFVSKLIYIENTSSQQEFSGLFWYHADFIIHSNVFEAFLS